MSDNQKNWHFAFAADLHLGTPRSYRFHPAWNANWQTAKRQIMAAKPEFLVVGGDMTRDGDTHRSELENALAEFSAMPFPVHVIPGNHEVGNKRKQLPRDADPSCVQADFLRLYQSVFGVSEWSFACRGIRFSGFNSLLPGSGLPEEGRLWDWLAVEAGRRDTQRRVWFMHVNLFLTAPDEPNWDPRKHPEEFYFGIDNPARTRLLDIFRRSGAELVISAHAHCRDQVTVDGICFYRAPATAFPVTQKRWANGDTSLGWVDFEVTDRGIAPSFVPLTQVAPDTDFYGPDGSPPVASRDYSQARQQPPLDINAERLPALPAKPG